MKIVLLCLLACTAAGTAAGLLILLLKKLFRDKLSPAWHCYVWLLVMAFFIIPVLVKPELPAIEFPKWELPQFEQTEDNLPHTDLSPSPQHPVESIKPVQPVKNETSSPSSNNFHRDDYVGSDVSGEDTLWNFSDPVNITDSLFESMITDSQVKNRSEELYVFALGMLVFIWLGGSICFLGKQWCLYHSFIKALKENSQEADEEEKLILKQVEESLGIRRPVKLAHTSLPISPMLVGIRQTTLYLPKESLSPRQLSLVFIHELTHYRYCDLIYKEAALIIRGLHWFNPLTYFMVEDIDFSCELCCDSRVRRHIGDENAKEYSALLLELLRNEYIKAPAVGFSMDKSSLKRRLSLIVKPKNTSKVLSVLLSLFIAVGGAVCSSAIAPTVSPEDLLTEKPIKDQSTVIDQNNSNDTVHPKISQLSFNSSEILEYQDSVNSDVVGWLQIPNLDIYEPVLQTDDNYTYTDRDVHSNITRSGAIFGDFQCKMDGTLRSDNTIIYGNNLKNKKKPYRSYKELDDLEMFEKLSVLHDYSVASRTAFIHYSTSETDYVWQIFAAIDAPVDLADKLAGRLNNSIIKEACENSLYYYGVDVDKDDMILTLCTQGASNDERFVVMAKRVESGIRVQNTIGKRVNNKDY